MDFLAQSLEWLLEEEGGYSNHPADTGGATNYGITQRVYDAWRIDQGKTPQPVLQITKSEVKKIYDVGYWQASGASKLPWPLSYIVFDAAVNSGPSRAAKWLQAAVGVEQDGKIGEKTIAAVRKTPDVNYKTIDQRLQFLVNLVKNNPSQIVFLKGWMRRLLRVLERATTEVGINNNG